MFIYIHKMHKLEDIPQTVYYKAFEGGIYATG